MEALCWLEPKSIREIEMQRALAERPQRLKKAAPRLLASLLLFMALFQVIEWSALWFALPIYATELLIFALIIFYPAANISAAWKGAPRGAASIRLSKSGVTRTAQKWEFVAWRNIENYRFESCGNAPDLRILIVEARGRKTPLRLYYEGENLEARLRGAMEQGRASTRETISQGTILT